MPKLQKPAKKQGRRHDSGATRLSLYAQQQRVMQAVTLALTFCAVLSGAGQTSELDSQMRDATAAQGRGDYASAIAEYREVVRSKPDFLPAWINLGVAQAHTGRFGEAIESYRKALALDEHNRQARTYLGLAYFKQGDAVQASREFAQLLESKPDDLRIATLLGAAYLQSGDNARASTVLQPFAASAGDNADFLWAFGSALIGDGKLRDGVAALEKMATQTNSAEAWLLSGQTLLRVNEFVRAKDDCERAAQANPNLSGVQTALGQSREKNAEYEGAIQAYAKAVEQNPKDFEAWLGLGSDQYFERDLDAARSSLKHALEIDAHSAPALYALALVDKAQAQPATAAGELEEVVKIRPDWLEAHVQLAALYFQLKKSAEGIRERGVVDRLSEQARKEGPAKF